MTDLRALVETLANAAEEARRLLDGEPGNRELLTATVRLEEAAFWAVAAQETEPEGATA